MRKYKLLLILLISICLLYACESKDEYIVNYENQINEIINGLDNTDKIINLDKSLELEDEIILSQITNYNEYETYKRNYFYDIKQSYEYGSYLSKVNNYILFNEIITIPNNIEIVIRKNNEFKDTIINDSKFNNYINDILNTQYINIIKEGNDIVYTILKESSDYLYTIYISNIEITLFSNGFIYFTIYNLNEKLNYVSLNQTDINEIDSKIESCEKKIVETEYLKIEIYDKDLNILEIIKTQREVMNYLNIFEGKEIEKCERYSLPIGSDTHVVNSVYMEYIEQVNKANVIYIYTNETEYIRIFNYNNERFFYFQRPLVYTVIVIE